MRSMKADLPTPLTPMTAMHRLAMSLDARDYDKNRIVSIRAARPIKGGFLDMETLSMVVEGHVWAPSLIPMR
jgi:hypothetical protein